MKKILTILITVLLVICCLATCACIHENANKSKFETLKNAINENGRTSFVSNTTKHYVKLDDNVELHYFDSSNTIIALEYSNSPTTFTIYIDSNLSGSYSWNLESYGYKIGGKLYTESSNNNYNIIEDLSKRSSVMSYSIAKSMNELAETVCDLCIIEFKEFIENKTNLKISDF